MENEGFDTIIDSICNLELRGNRQLSQLVKELETMGGRITPLGPMESLTLMQKAIIEIMGDFPILRGDETNKKESRHIIDVGIYKFGRLHLNFCVSDLLDKNILPIGKILLNDKLKNNILKRYKSLSKSIAESENSAIKYMENSSFSNLHKMIDLIIHGVDHVDPMLLYVKNATFTNFSSYNNLLPKNNLRKPGFLLIDIRGKPIENWSLEEKLFIFSTYSVLNAGFRLEEFSGSIVEPYTVEKYFISKYEEYNAVIRPGISTTLQSFSRMDIISKSSILSSLKKEMEPKFVFFRKINGLNFAKEEKFIDRSLLDKFAAPVPQTLLATAQLYSTKVSPINIENLFQDIIYGIFEQHKSNPEILINKLEYLIECVVKEAIVKLNADIGMSRGIRNIRKWQRCINMKNYEEIISWPTTDYFCAVWASDTLLASLINQENGQQAIVKLFQTIAARMTFNSWHYMPSHFYKYIEGDVRHYYFAPKMVDTAEWSDQHHNGHIFASVRYSIRAPTSIFYASSEYHGMNDLRLMRQGEGPFTQEELFLARSYSKQLQILYQNIANQCEDHDLEIAIRSFSKEWYALEYSQPSDCAIYNVAN